MDSTLLTDQLREMNTQYMASDASVGIMAHNEPRTGRDSDEAVCLQARSIRPLSITHDAIIHGAMSDATLSAWRAGAHEIQLSARRRQSCRSSGCFQAWSMLRNGFRAGPTPLTSLPGRHYRRIHPRHTNS